MGDDTEVQKNNLTDLLRDARLVLRRAASDYMIRASENQESNPAMAGQLRERQDRVDRVLEQIDQVDNPEHAPEHTDADLLERSVRNARPGSSGPQTPRWVAVRDAIGVGSTRACELCLRFGLDPEEMV